MFDGRKWDDRRTEQEENKKVGKMEEKRWKFGGSLSKSKARKKTASAVR